MINVSELQMAVAELRKKKPLVLSLTNVVTMDFMANCLLALGASPIMSQSLDEAEELLTISQALNINIGTLDKQFTDNVLQAAKWAGEKKIPVVMDPVGAGASRLRTSTSQALIPLVDIIRGNASEILALAQGISGTKGVESTLNVNASITAAHFLTKLGKTVVVSGETDFVSDGNLSQFLSYGSQLMPLITGMGCTLTAVIAAFAGIGLNHYKAALFGTAYFSLCGQLAGKFTQFPGSFRQVFIDQLYAPDWEYIQTLNLKERKHDHTI